MRPGPLLGLAALIGAIAACGGATTTDTTEAGSTSTSAAEMTTTIVATTSSTFEATTTSTLAGGLIDFGPQSGDVLAVIGVRYDDALNLRARPGPTQPILDTIDPLYDGLIAAGETWQLPAAFWIKVDYQSVIGWVHLGYIAYLGATDDVTSRVISDMGQIPKAGSMEELGLLVAESFVSDDPPSEVVMTAPATLSDLGEVTYDVVGLGDDAVRGLRLQAGGSPALLGAQLRRLAADCRCAAEPGAHRACGAGVGRQGRHGHNPERRRTAREGRDL